MRMLIKEFAVFTGVSVRTLHYYDEIGLLTPAYIDKNSGYRFYDESSILRMQEILFYRELDFSLKDIREILSSPNYDKAAALTEQKKMLTLKKERLERLIAAIDNAVKGENIMNVFDNSEFEKYKYEAKEKWGSTEAYKEYAAKPQSSHQNIAYGLNSILAEFAECLKIGESPDSDAAQTLVKKLQNHITKTCYTCTNEILAGLGQMYVCDERFKNNIDQNGEGTAEFISSAISFYCTEQA